jgi:hypothetical protein
MPTRTVSIAGKRWSVFPSGRVTPNDRDEFALLFVTGADDQREIRVTRYSPMGARSREQSLMEMSDAELTRLFEYSQPSDTSPEADYAA